MDTRRAARLPKSEPGRPGTFDLQELMLKAHNSVAAEADARNLALSWFTAPYLPRAYEGDREKLAEVLHMLAESAVRATQRGAVHIRVQRVPESADPGHLLFTIRSLLCARGSLSACAAVPSAWKVGRQELPSRSAYALRRTCPMRRPARHERRIALRPARRNGSPAGCRPVCREGSPEPPTLWEHPRTDPEPLLGVR